MPRVFESARPTLLASALIVPALFLGVLSMAQEKAPDQEKTAKPTSEEKYKNIKVLKQLPADELIPLMRKVNTALGVKCDFCHVIAADHTGFEKDDKPMKDKSRDMIRMVMDVNKNYKSVEGKVRCFTCHQGHAEPQNEPASKEPK